MILGKRDFRVRSSLWQTVLIVGLLVTPLAHAGAGGDSVRDFLWIGLLLLLAKISSLIEKWGQPAVLGELVVGVLLGNLILLGIDWVEPIKHDEVIKFLAELGVVILLFQIGLESNVDKMRKVGLPALLVASVGVIAPFFLGYLVVGPWLMPGLSNNAYLFLGATLTATSVGITARVFQDLNKLQTPEAQIVLGAAVIDDVMGLVILAVVSAIVTTGSVSLMTISWITLKAFLFLFGALVIGQWIAPHLGKLLSKIGTGSDMKFIFAIIFCLFFAYLAHLMGLAPIIGAFAAGLLMEHVVFETFDDPTINDEIETAVAKADVVVQKEVAVILKHHNERHVEELIKPLGHFLVPLFFIMTGIQVNLETLADVKILGIALAITAVAFVGKLVSGFFAGNVNKWIVGWGMAPRGEVGLIFAMIGKQLGVVSEEMFSVIIIMVILTTLLTPPILSYLLRQHH
jgi:Kef-type K+ transport system membrane component KefB